MSRGPAWKVDPAWPFAPALEPDELQPEDDEPPVPAGPLAQLRRHQAEAHAAQTRQLIRDRRARRLASRQPGANPAPFALAPGAAPPRRPGHPGHRTRNDRLLTLFETTAAHLPHLQRCRIAARLLAAEVAERAGVPVERARIMPATTARDAIAEARRRRAIQPATE